MAEILFDLQMFAEGSAPAGDGATTGENAGTPTAQGEQAATPTAEDRDALYKKFKEDFKDQYDADVQAVVKDRLKKSKAESKSYRERLDKLAPIIEETAKKYGVEADDYDSILLAFKNDDKRYEEEAYAKGMTVEQVKYIHQIEDENRALMAAQEDARRQRQIEEWDRQFAELLSIYPNVDPATEMQNDTFLRYMNAGVPIRDAFEIVHKDELTAGAMQFTANKVAEKMANAARTNSSHPDENGMNKQAAAVMTPNISSMTLEQMKEMINRARAGEQIDLRNHF